MSFIEMEQTIACQQMELDDLRAKLKEAQADAEHWKNNHETEVRRARILKERTDMPIERVDAYEQWGKDQMALKEAREAAEFNFQQYQDAGRLLCEAQAKIERLYSERGIISGHLIKKLHGQLAASQANEVQLRDELFAVLVMDMPAYKARLKVHEIPSDTTALDTMIQKAGEVMRERAAKACEYRGGFDLAKSWSECVKAIRALPGVTLEDLK